MPLTLSRRQAAGVLLGFALASCSKKKKKIPVAITPSPRQGTKRPAPTVTPGDVETGVASWYGNPYHGRATASGEIYDMEKLTAAHRTLPFGAEVRVVNTVNKKSVDVRITDRGPFVDNRIIDLSHAAAREIEMIGPGTAPVRLEILSAPAAPSGALAIQVGAFQNRENADKLRLRMEQSYGSARLVRREGRVVLWRVLVGREANGDGAKALRARLLQENPEEIREAWIVRLDDKK